MPEGEPHRAGAWGRWTAALLTGAAFVAALTVFVSGSVQVATIRQGAGGHLVATLALPAGQGQTPASPPAAERIAHGLLARPLDPVLVNAGVYRDAALHPSHALPAAKLSALAQLGWRYTPALQNRIYATALSGNLANTVSLAEALLRRQTVVDQATAVLNLVEGDPAARPLLLAKLRVNPRWRTDYMQAVDQLRAPAQVRARGELALRLQAGGSPLRRDELGPIASRLVAFGMTDLAYRIWRNDARAPAMPLNDPDFRRLFAQRGTDVIAMPFEWILRSENGAWTEVRRDGRAMVDIHWDGRNTPVFLQQQTLLTPGRYTLRIEGPDARPDMLKAIAFEAHCGHAPPVRFDQPVRAEQGALLVASRRSVECRDPIFFVQGIAPENRPLGLAKLVEGDEGITVTLAGLSLVANR